MDPMLATTHGQSCLPQPLRREQAACIRVSIGALGVRDANCPLSNPRTACGLSRRQRSVRV